MKKRNFSFGAVVGVCVLVGGAPACLAQAGIDWVSPAPAVPVEQVERMVLPPSPADGGPVSLTATPHRSVGTVVPRRTSSGETTISRALPAGADVYPPPGNRAARPLGGSTFAAPPMPVTSPIVQPTIDQPPAVAKKPVAQPTPVMAPVVVQEPLAVAPVARPAPIAAPVVQKNVVLPPLEVERTQADVPVPVIDGFGDRVPLSVAIEQIVPSDYVVDVQGGLDTTLTVSWAGGRPFDKVLEDAIYAHGYRVLVDGKQVILHPASAPIKGATVWPSSTPGPQKKAQPIVDRPSGSGAAQPRPAPVSEVAGMTLEPVSPVAVAPVVPVTQPVASRAAPAQTRAAPTYNPGQIDIFSGRVGEPLQTVLLRWTRIARLDLDWAVPDGQYALSQSFAMNTTFPRALEKIMALYKTQRPPFVATIAPGQTPKLMVRMDGAKPLPLATQPASAAQRPQQAMPTAQPKYQSPGFTFE